MKLEKRGPVTVTHLHVVDVVAIPLLCVLCFWHILKPLYSLHLFCLLLHSSEQYETIQCLHKLYKSTWNMPHNMCLVCSRKLPFDPEERGT